MTTIWKFPIEITYEQLLHMPKGAEIFAAQMQAEQLCLWALVDTTAPMTGRYVAIYGTGNPIPEMPRRFIGTVQYNIGPLPLVWHVFELL